MGCGSSGLPPHSLTLSHRLTLSRHRQQRNLDVHSAVGCATCCAADNESIVGGSYYTLRVESDIIPHETEWRIYELRAVASVQHERLVLASSKLNLPRLVDCLTGDWLTEPADESLPDLLIFHSNGTRREQWGISKPLCPKMERSQAPYHYLCCAFVLQDCHGDRISRQSGTQ